LRSPLASVSTLPEHAEAVSHPSSNALMPPSRA
jgi:hypothetical protein